MLKIKKIVLFLKLFTQLLLIRSFGNIIHDIAESSNQQLTVQDLRKLEKLYIRNNKAGLHVNFLRNCKNFNVYPKFICFKMPLASNDDVKRIRNHLLKNAIHRKIKEKWKFNRELETQEKDIRSKLNGISWYLLYNAIHVNVKKSERKQIETHEKKLQNLTKGKKIPFSHHEIIKNFSSHKLSEEEYAEALKKYQAKEAD